MFSVSVSQWTNKDREKTGLSIRAAQWIKNIIEIAVNLCQAELCSWRPTSSKKNIVMMKQHFLANIATSDREYVWLKYWKCHWQRSRSRNIWRHRTEWVKSWKLQIDPLTQTANQSDFDLCLRQGPTNAKSAGHTSPTAPQMLTDDPAFKSVFVLLVWLPIIMTGRRWRLDLTYFGEMFL